MKEKPLTLFEEDGKIKYHAILWVCVYSPKMNDTTYDFTYFYSKYGLIGLITCWFTEHPEWTPRQIAEMWLHVTTLGLWGILGDDGKEVLLNAKNSR